MSAEELRQAAETLHTATGPGIAFPIEAAEILAEVLEVAAYVKKYEPSSDYFPIAPNGDPIERFAALINGGAS